MSAVGNHGRADLANPGVPGEGKKERSLQPPFCCQVTFLFKTFLCDLVGKWAVSHYNQHWVKVGHYVVSGSVGPFARNSIKGGPI